MNLAVQAFLFETSIHDYEYPENGAVSSFDAWSNNDVSWDLSVSYIVSLSASWAVSSVSNPLSIGAGDLCHAVTTVSGRIIGT